MRGMECSGNQEWHIQEMLHRFSRVRQFEPGNHSGVSSGEVSGDFLLLHQRGTRPLDGTCCWLLTPL